MSCVLGWQQLGTAFVSGSAALWGRRLCQNSPEVFSDRCFRKSQCRNGRCRLEKQEEACEVLCSSAGCQSVGELRHVILRGLQAPDPSSLGV